MLPNFHTAFNSDTIMTDHVFVCHNRAKCSRTTIVPGGNLTVHSTELCHFFCTFFMMDSGFIGMVFNNF